MGLESTTLGSGVSHVPLTEPAERPLLALCLRQMRYHVKSHRQPLEPHSARYSEAIVPTTSDYLNFCAGSLHSHVPQLCQPSVRHLWMRICLMGLTFSQEPSLSNTGG